MSHSRRAHQREAEEKRNYDLELDLQELERLRTKLPRVQPRTMWAKRAKRNRRGRPSKLPLPSDNGEASCSHEAGNDAIVGPDTDDVDKEPMEVEEMEEEEEVESVDMEVDTNGGMSVLSCREQDSLVGQPTTETMGSLVDQPTAEMMGQRLEFFSRQMNSRHKPTTTRVYAQHTASWQVYIHEYSNYHYHVICLMLLIAS